jgi:branched-chain amino acid transport system substrate-binding protein
MAAVLFTACAGGTAGQPSASPGGPIKIGMVTSLTGNYTPLGTGNKQGAQLVVDQVNARGGINGRKLELVMLDDGTNPNQTITHVNTLNDQAVVALLGPPQSTADLAIKPIVNQLKLPTVALGAADQQTVPVTPYMWQTALLSSQVARGVLSYLQQQGKGKIAMLTDTANAYAVSGHDATRNALGGYGVTLVDDESFETATTNFAPLIAKVVAARPDVVLFWGTGSPPVVFTKQWAAASTGLPLMMTAAEATPLYTSAVGPAGEGVYVQAVMADLGQSLPTANRYRRIVDSYAVPFQQAYNSYPAQFSWDAIIAMMFLVDAIKRKGASREEIRAGLDSINLETPNGHYSFSPSRHNGFPDTGVVISIIRNGQFTQAPGVSDAQLQKAGQ